VVDTIVGRGATEADKTMMRTPSSDAFADDSGMSIYVRGRAMHGGVVKSFDWPFRYRARYDRCAPSPALSGSTSVTTGGLDFRTNVAQSVVIEVSPGALFADELNATVAQPRFQVFADADTVTGNADGIVTLEELGRVPLSKAGFLHLTGSRDGGGSTGIDAAGTFAGIEAGFLGRVEEHFDGGSEASLEDYVYLVLFPSMIRYEGIGSCGIRLTNRGVGQ
jgi:hypothetical protein